MVLQPMYPAQANSPQTELAGSINDIVTTISLVDASKLPAAPNLATIGKDENAETIHYTGIVGNDLTGVTRGFQGIAKSWSIGAKVGRYFTAYDHDTFVNNVEELFTSVSDGKTLVAAAITGKGVPTAVGDTFQVMADNIGDIVLGSGDALPGDVRAGKTFSNDSGPDKVGTVPVQDGGNVIPTATDIVKPAGIYDTPITVKGVVVPAANVLAGTTIAGTPGTMPNNAGDKVALASSVVGTTLKLRPPMGFTDGVDDYVTITDPDFIAANIKKDINLLGLVGNYVGDVKRAAGSATSVHAGSDYEKISVRGLTFPPRLVVCYQSNGARYSGIAEETSWGSGVYRNYFPEGQAITQGTAYNNFQMLADGFDMVTGVSTNDGTTNSLIWVAYS